MDAVKPPAPETISSQLLEMIRESGLHPGILRARTKLDPDRIRRFLDGTRPDIRLDMVDALCKAIGCQLTTRDGAAATVSTISGQLRGAIVASGLTHYRLSKLAKVDCGSIDRFVVGTRTNLHVGTVNKLCQALGCRLVTTMAPRE